MNSDKMSRICGKCGNLDHNSANLTAQMLRIESFYGCGLASGVRSVGARRGVAPRWDLFCRAGLIGSFMRASKHGFERSAGVLLPVSSLPSPYGIGNIGCSARRWVDSIHEGLNWGRPGKLVDHAKLCRNRAPAPCRAFSRCEDAEAVCGPPSG